MAALSMVPEPVLYRAQTADTDSYELVLLNSMGTHVLLQQQDRGHTLPIISIPRFTRPAREITSALRGAWNIKAVLLWSGQIEVGSSGDYFAVLEAIDCSGQLLPGLEWLVVEQAVDTLSIPQGSLLGKSTAKTLTSRSGPDPEPFSRLGWLRRLESWVDDVVRPRGIQLRDFSQFNGSETFSLVRFDTDSKPLWFKAVGAPNMHEFSITLLLSRLFPEHLPQILTSDPLRNGWLMESGGDLTLSDFAEIEIWIIAIQRLAELQILSLGRASELLQSGCRDLRLPALKSLVSPFFDAMTDLMARQTKHSPPPLTIRELIDLSERVRQALDTLAEAFDSNTLGHTDFNPGNWRFR